MAEQYFLTISGINGGSTDKQYKNSIPLTSFSFGADAPVSGGATRQQGTPVFSSINVSAAESQATPQLLSLLASRTPADTAVIYGRVTVGSGSTATQIQQLQISLTNVFIETMSESAGSGSVPTDSFSLNYGSIAYSYTPIVGGKPGTPIIVKFTPQNGVVQQSEIRH